MDFKGKKVLLVEDQEMFREAMEFELESLGFSVVTAVDGEDGYKKAMADRFDFILSDIKMPNWDGKRFLIELQKTPERKPPFAFITGYADISNYEAYDLGADAYLGKPADMDMLTSTVANLLLPTEVLWARRSESEPEHLFERTIEDWDDPGFSSNFALGRRGMCLALTLREVIGSKAGERVKFHIRLPGAPVPELKGTGLIVWERSALEGDRIHVGLEWEFIEEKGRKALLDYLAKERPLSAIPFRQFP